MLNLITTEIYYTLSRVIIWEILTKFQNPPYSNYNSIPPTNLTA